MAATIDLPTASYPPSELIPGYPIFAGRIGLIPEIATFRRFGALNSQNLLLYLQAQLVSLEQELTSPLLTFTLFSNCHKGAAIAGRRPPC